MTPQSTQAERPLCTQLREQTLALRWALERPLELRGRSNATEPVWQSFRLILDSCGPHRPQDHTDVGQRTERTFGAMQTRLGLFPGAVDALP